MRLLGYVLDGDDVFVQAKCPVCGSIHYYFDFVWNIDFANAYGEPFDPENILDIACDECERRARKYEAKQIMEMAMDGDLENYNEYLSEIRLIELGASVHLDA